MKLSSFHLFGKIFHSPKAYHAIKYVAVSLTTGVPLENIIVKEMYGIVIKNLGRLTFSRKTSANVLKSDASK